MSKAKPRKTIQANPDSSAERIERYRERTEFYKLIAGVFGIAVALIGLIMFVLKEWKESSSKDEKRKDSVNIEQSIIIPDTPKDTPKIVIPPYKPPVKPKPLLLKAWKANSGELSHRVGFGSSGGSWISRPSDASSDNGEAFSIYGPYVTMNAFNCDKLRYFAFWDMEIDDNSSDHDPIVTLEVFKTEGELVLQKTTVSRTEWDHPNKPQRFTVNFTLKPEELAARIQFRAKYHNKGVLKFNKVGVYCNNK